jgi:hypothetical protein
VSFGTESFPEVKEHLANEYSNGTKQGTKVTAVLKFPAIFFGEMPLGGYFVPTS